MTNKILQPHTEAFDRLDTMIAEGRLTRRQWTGVDAQGRETACLIAALWPEAGEKKTASACPADLLPRWLANLAPWIDDAPRADAWPALMRRAAAVFRRLHTLDAAALRRCEYRHRASCVREAASYTDVPYARAACDRVAQLCDRVVTGDEPSANDWAAASASAEAASASAEASASAASASAAWAAAASAASARAAAWAAASAASAAWASAAWAAGRIISALLDSLETEIQMAEEQSATTKITEEKKP